MNIAYAQNPMATIVELDGHDRQILRLKLEIEDLTEKIDSAAYEIEKGSVAVAKKILDCTWLDNEKAAARESRFFESLSLYEVELRSAHVGDCTCVACTCLKCHAEFMLDIDTIKGLGKHLGHRISSVFHTNPQFTCWQAIQHMKQNPPTPHEDRLTREHYEAIAWLERYVAEKLNSTI